MIFPPPQSRGRPCLRQSVRSNPRTSLGSNLTPYLIGSDHLEPLHWRAFSCCWRLRLCSARKALPPKTRFQTGRSADRAVPAGRTDRHHGTSDQSIAVGAARAASLCRQSARRRFDACRQDRCDGGPRRLHAPARQRRHARDRADALPGTSNTTRNALCRSRWWPTCPTSWWQGRNHR